MGLIDKIKNKLFPDEEKEVLYYKTESVNKENNYTREVSLEEKLPINFKPTTFADTEEISNCLKKGNAVVVDVDLLDKKEANKMLVFLAGVMHALNGDMKRINKTTFEYTVKNRPY